jgi:hypothetical protein
MIPDLHDEKKRLIATLKHDVAYRTLVDFLQVQVDAIADDLAEAGAPADILRLTRLWQVSRKFVHILRTAPETMDDLIAAEQGRESGEHHPWAMPEDEDYFRRAAPRVPYAPANIEVE